MSTLHTLKARYSRAVTDSMDDSLSNTAHNNAVAEMVEARKALDSAMVEAVEPAGFSAGAQEARDRASSIVAGSSGTMTAVAGPSESDIRNWLDPDHSQKTLHLPLAGSESRANEWYKTAGAGIGATVPTTVLDRVIYHVNNESGIFPNAYHLLTSTGEDVTVPILTTDAAATLTAEGSAATPGAAVFGSETLKSYRLDVTFPISNELLRDSAVNIQRVVGDAAGRAIGTLLGQYLATGSGAAEPEGVTIGGVSAFTAAATTSLTLDEVKRLLFSLPARARKGSVFVGGSDVALLLASMKDDSGDYLLQPQASEEDSDRIFGKKFFEDAAMPAMTAGLKPLACFNPDYFWVRLVDRGGGNGGIELAFSSDYEFVKNVTWARAAMWVDSRVIGAGGECRFITMHA